jgi:CheY-like chemotaxis protein
MDHSARRGRILVVDDNRDGRELVAELLAEEGYVVEAASDGPSALSKLKTFPADLLLTDLQMPGMDGVELIQRFRASDPSRRAILFTGARSPDFRALVACSGAAACVHKPIDLDTLIMVIEKTLEASIVPRRSVEHAVQ